MHARTPFAKTRNSGRGAAHAFIGMATNDGAAITGVHASSAISESECSNQPLRGRNLHNDAPHGGVGRGLAYTDFLPTDGERFFTENRVLMGFHSLHPPKGGN